MSTTLAPATRDSSIITPPPLTLIAGAGDGALIRFLELFTVNIRN
jgi:hypothetical protein